MPNLTKAFASLRELPPTRALHSRIMRRIFLINFRPHLAWLAGLLVLNLGVSMWYFIDRAHALSTFALLQTLAGNFQLDMDYAADSAQTLFESFPVGSTLTLVMNTILTIYIIRLMLRVRNVAKKL